MLQRNPIERTKLAVENVGTMRRPRICAAREKTGAPSGPRFIGSLHDGTDAPVHERVYQRIRHLILSGFFSNGSRIAASRALAASLGISRNSVLTAIERLIADGLVESRRGSGTYVVYSGPRVAAPFLPAPLLEEGGCVPFQLGWAFDIFPTRIWKRLQLRRWRQPSDGGFLQLGRATGWPQLREAIAAHVAMSRGIECSPDQVIVTTCGPSAANLVVRALGLSGSESWVEDPACQSLIGALQSSGVHVVPVPVDEEGIQVEAGKRLSPHARLALVTPSCQAPTGVKLGEGRRRSLVRWAHDNNAWVFEDDFNYSTDQKGRLVLPLATLDQTRTFYFNSFNHTLFPGLRIAYFITPPALVDRFAAVQGKEGDVNVPNQMILADFIEGGYLDDHLRRLQAHCSERRAILNAAVEEKLFQFLTPHESTSSNYFVCTLNGVAENALIESCKEQNLVIRGMATFCAIRRDIQQIVLGFAPYKPKKLLDSAAGLRSVFEMLHQRDSRCIRVAASK